MRSLEPNGSKSLSSSSATRLDLDSDFEDECFSVFWRLSDFFQRAWIPVRELGMGKENGNLDFPDSASDQPAPIQQDRL